jgi:hypothetical protein
VKPGALWAATCLGSLALALAGPARADKMTSDQCVSASEDGQLAKIKGRLRVAREKLLACSAAACPKVVRQDCSASLEEVDKAMPSVVFGARDGSGRDLTDVRVFVDGTERVTHLDGKAVEIDPGPHSLRFESAGLPRYEKELLVHEGEKSRVISVTLGKIEEKRAPPTRSPESPPPTAARSPSAATWIVGGVGAAALVGAGVVGFVALNQRSSLYDRCGRAGTCEQSEVDSVYRLYDISYVSAGVGGALLVTGVVLYFTTSKSKEQPQEAALGVAPTLGGVNVRGRF